MRLKSLEMRAPADLAVALNGRDGKAEGLETALDVAKKAARGEA